VQEEYLKQYMAQVMAIQERQQAARAGTLDTQGHQELQDLKVELAVAEGTAPCLTMYTETIACVW